MAHDLDPALQAAIDAPSVRPFLAIHIDLPDPVRVFTGQGTMLVGGQTFIGGAGFGSIDTISEGTDGSAVAVRVALYKIPAELAADVEAQATKGALMEVFLGALTADFRTVVGFKLVWKGRLDTYEINDGGESLSVTITGESRMRDQRRPAIKRYTNEYQQRKYPGDKFFEYVPQMAEIPILWARASQDATGGGGGGSGGGSLGGSGNAYL
ncbi:MAG TPA: hypothetical protein VKB96_11025 [Gammaproteobacteria bacterium]|nr:hypothetical protein [Gammaproteobacteria bacterium]